MARPFEELYKKFELKGEQKGIQKGIEQGKREEQLAMARKLLLKGMEIELISEVTGLSKEEINDL